jgi:hypothetical protein
MCSGLGYLHPLPRCRHVGQAGQLERLALSLRHGFIIRKPLSNVNGIPLFMKKFFAARSMWWRQTQKNRPKAVGV